MATPLRVLILDDRPADAELMLHELRRSGFDPAKIIEQEIERMGHLVANLLQFSRRSQPQIFTVDVRQEITQTLDLISNHLRNHRIRVVREFALDVPMIYADCELLRQLFLNLRTNASDAMPQGGTLTIHVAVGVLESGAPAVVIEFVDTGGGYHTRRFAESAGAIFHDETGRAGHRAGVADLSAHRTSASWDIQHYQ